MTALCFCTLLMFAGRYIVCSLVKKLLDCLVTNFPGIKHEDEEIDIFLLVSKRPFYKCHQTLTRHFVLVQKEGLYALSVKNTKHF